MIRVDVDGRGWQTLGADLDRGVYPDGIAPTWDSWGNAALTFSLARDPSRSWPDLAAATPIEYLPYGAGDGAAWGGYIDDTPAAGEEGLTVNAKGWQYPLDDDPYVDTFVVDDLTKWQDARSAPGSYLFDGALGWTQSGTVQAGDGEITFAWPQGAIVKPNSALGVFIDLGPLSRGAVACAVDYTVPQAWGTLGGQLYVRGSNVPSQPYFGSSGGFEDGGGPFGLPVGSTSVLAAYGGTYRYVAIFPYTAGGGTPASEHTVKITRIRVFTDNAYRAGSASALKASQIVTRALGRVPALSQDTSLITTTAFVIPAYGGVNEVRTARTDIEQANTYHRWIARVLADRRLEFRPKFGAATLEANTRRPGVDWQDASVNNLEDVVNKVTVTGRTGSGSEIAVTRTSSDVGIRNVLDRRNRTRSKTLEVASPTDVSTMQTLADVYLTRYARTPLRGTLTITGPEALRTITGRPVPAGFAGPRVGEIVALSNLVDPDTGAAWRDAVTAGGTYNEDEDQATLAIDNTRDDLEGLLARMGVVAGN